MTPTPRTDAAIQAYYDNGQSFAVVEPELSRQLEREIAELNERLIDRQQTLMETLIENQNLRRILMMPTNKLALSCSRCGNEQITSNQPNQPNQYNE